MKRYLGPAVELGFLFLVMAALVVAIEATHGGPLIQSFSW